HLAEPRPDMPRERQWQVRAREVVLAAGALERPLVFPGNDRPGIMLAGAARTWINGYGVLPGTRAVVVTACDEAYDAALELQDAGVFVAAIAELRTGAGGAEAAKARAAGIPVLPRATVLGTGGRRRVNSISLAQPDDAGEPLAATPAPANGSTAAPGFVGVLPRPARGRGRAFVDWQNDVTASDLELALREGFRSIEHVKRYTTTGMATDQGKTSNLNALGIVSRTLGKPIPEVGLTTFRMPYTPVSFGSFAGPARGELLDPVRTTPMHEWARAHGAVFEDVGLWKRARYFPRGGEDMHAAVGRECRAVRGGCGLFDASTLGKIEVVGRDAVLFLERLYVNAWASLAVGRARYGILLRDDGFIYDDGVVARVSARSFHVTTTTGGAPRVLAMMEDYLQTEWPDLEVWLTSTTEQWAVIAVQGPDARAVLSGLVDIDISASAMPHMGVAPGYICGVPMRLFRVSFTGELGFEVSVPADF